jgi:molecular chaperone GrpE
VSERPEDPERVVIRDNRKIDPVTGEARKKSEAGSSEPDGPRPGAVSAEEDVPKAEALLLEERTRDLQRLQAEYANYRKRMERDLQAVEQRGVGKALAALLPVLDDWDRAHEHGDVTGPIEAILEKQNRALAMLGLVPVGFEGDNFDPAIHEAVMHDESADVSVPTATKVLRKGYQHGDRLLRPAMVGVTDPISAAPAEPATDAAGAAEPAPDPAAHDAVAPDDQQD